MSDNKDCMLSWELFQDGLCMEFQINRVIQGAEWSETVDAVGEGCNRCGKKSHKTSECNTDMTGVKCFKCGKTGHIGRNCLNQGQNQNKADNKKPAKGGGKQDKKEKVN